MGLLENLDNALSKYEIKKTEFFMKFIIVVWLMKLKLAIIKDRLLNEIREHISVALLPPTCNRSRPEFLKVVFRWNLLNVMR